MKRFVVGAATGLMVGASLWIIALVFVMVTTMQSDRPQAIPGIVSADLADDGSTTSFIWRIAAPGSLALMLVPAILFAVFSLLTRLRSREAPGSDVVG